jgi:hypothetical protein
MAFQNILSWHRYNWHPYLSYWILGHYVFRNLFALEKQHWVTPYYENA